MVARELDNPTLFRTVYDGQQANCSGFSQMPMYTGHSYLPLNDTLPPQAQEIMNHIGEESDDDANMWHPNQR